MKWRKLGKIYSIENKIDEFLISHAANPLPIYFDSDIFRIFFSGRNNENKSSVGYVDLNIVSQKIVKVCEKAVFTYGGKKSFYSHGVSIGCNYNIDENNYILFMGWQVRENQHWRGDIGRLKLNNDLNRLVLSPNEVFIGCDEEDLISLSYPFILKEDEEYKMWYGSTLSWTSENGEMIHVIKFATSKDGETWIKKGTAIPYEIGVAQAFSRPVVIKDKNEYKMWYSYRSGNGTTYRIGYAYSPNGINWTRKDEEVGIDVSKEGWDSEMICYPFVFDYKGNRYMLYSGNGFGKTGFGLAVLEQDS